MQLQVMHTGACEQTDVELVSRVAEHADVPHCRYIRDGGKPFAAPLFEVLLDPVAAEHDEHFLMAQDRAVHGIENIGYEVIVKRVVEQYAPAAQQFQPGRQIILIELQASPKLPAHKTAIALRPDVVAVFKLTEKLVIRPGIGKCPAHCSIFGAELVAEQAAQHRAHKRIVSCGYGAVILAVEHVAQFLPGESVEQEEYLPDHYDAKRGIIKPREQFLPVHIARNHDCRCGHYQHSYINRLQQGPALPVIIFYAPLFELLVLLIEQARGKLEKAAAVFEQRLHYGDKYPLEDYMGEHEQRVRHEEHNERHIRVPQRTLKRISQVPHEISEAGQPSVKRLRQPLCKARQQCRQLLNERSERFAYPRQEGDEQHTVDKCQHGHQELAAPVSLFQVRAHIQKREQKKREKV